MADPAQPAQPPALRRAPLAPPPGTLGGLLAATAEAHGCLLALRAGQERLTFAELDAAATRCATAVRAQTAPGAAVAVVSELDPAFAIAYYGIARAGRVVVPVNPLLPGASLARLLAISGAALALVPEPVVGRLREAGGSLPPLRPLAWVRAALAAGAAARPAAEPEPSPADVACIQFTSGTTGAPKGVMLTHASLTVNAAQIAQAHNLAPGAVALNHLPTYHPMHLNSAVAAGTTQVLCADPDLAASVGLANEAGATHYYSLPVRLSRLAADPRLPDLRLHTVRMIASGGSALPPGPTRALSAHFGIPVFQGYGLAETAPLTHSDGPPVPRVGSVGVPVAGTQCRVIDLSTGAVLDHGQPGEVQVRGPQVMLGYLSAGEPGVGADGWLRTGDVGYIDPDGYLYLLDRINDVFKRDNWLVAPSAIEEALRAHPAVADCVVLGLPDPHSGSVPVALLVLRDGVPEEAAGEAAAAASGRMADYERPVWVRAVPEIPRAANGKISRVMLREQLLGERSAPASPGG
jgi:long-chain acyl-CoA synthetase